MTPDARRVAAALIIINNIKKRRIQQKAIQKRTHRWWIKELYRNRIQHGCEQLLLDISFENGESFKNFTRMSTGDFEWLLSMVTPLIEKKDTKFRCAIPARERLVVTLRYLATGDSYTSLQYLFRISKQSISKIIAQTTGAIIEVLKDYIKLPLCEEEWLQLARDWENKWNFPHCIASMDGKHIVLQAPINSGSEYINYKDFFSIVLLGLVDANYNFIYANVGCQGRISDGGVFKNTTLYKKLEKKELSLPEPKIIQVPYAIKVPYMILADKAFALNNYTMKPFEGNPSYGSSERIFNYRLSRARRVVENVFGIMSSVFRVLRKPMLLEPEIATKVVLAIVHLHNFLRKSNQSSQIYMPPGSIDRETENGNFEPGSWRNEEMSQFLPIRAVPRRAAEQPKSIRLHLAHHFVTNGILPWQNDY